MTITRFVEYPRQPAEVLAVRYLPGGPVDDLLLLAEHEDGHADLSEVPELHCLVVRVGESPDSRFLVVPGGSWLVLKLGERRVTVRSDDEFATEYTLKDDGLVEAVASTIGLHMICRESPTQIALAAIATVTAHQYTETVEPPF